MLPQHELGAKHDWDPQLSKPSGPPQFLPKGPDCENREASAIDDNPIMYRCVSAFYLLGLMGM